MRLHRIPMLALAATILASLWLAATALAEPQLEVTLTHEPETMPRNDEFLTYTAKVKNEGSEEPKVGDELKCVGPNPEKTWFPGGADSPTYEIEWLRNGVIIPEAGGPWSEGEPATQFYTATAADEGQPIQCMIKGTNAIAAGVYASLPARAVSPQPPVAPPAPSDRFAKESRPWVTDESGVFNSAHGKAVGVKRYCQPPSNWTEGAVYTYQWFRNAVPIVGATSSEYEPVAEDDETNLQCKVTGTNAGGSVVSYSNRSGVTITGKIPANVVSDGSSAPLEATVAPPAEEPVVLDLEFPAGEETQVFEVVSAGGWNCQVVPPTPSTPAALSCERADTLVPGAEYPQVKVGVSLGADAPEPAIAKAEVSGGGSVPSSAEDTLVWLPPVPFGIEAFEARAVDQSDEDETRAGAHPFAADAALELATKVRADGTLGVVERARQLKTELPTGFIGNPEAVPELCPSTVDVASDTFAEPVCPRVSIVGGISLVTEQVTYTDLPVYAIEPERGAPAQFAFVLRDNNRAVYTLAARLRPDEGYAISLDAPTLPKAPILISADVRICGFGAVVKDGGAQLLGGAQFERCRKHNEPEASPKPLLTNPTRCAGGAPVSTLRLDSWEGPGELVSKSFTSPPVVECDAVPFTPTVKLSPTTEQADSPTGLDVSITMPTAGLESPTGISQAHLKRVVVTLPPGMAVNPAAANGLAACTQAQLGMTNGVPDDQPARCPGASKIGSVEIVTPLLDEPLGGAIYLAKQGDNPFGTLLALYLVAESAERGIVVKIPGRVEPRPDGQLIARFDNNPQVPFASLDVTFNSGARAPLLTPPVCGNYAIASSLSSWSAADPENPTAAETVSSTSYFTIRSGPGGASCPRGNLSVGFGAGLVDPTAATRSPFVMRLTRPDASQRMNSLEATLPPGLVGYLRGIPYCPDSALAAVSGAAGTGAGEIAAPSCPSASQLGHVSVGAGAGSNPFYVDTGRAYLAGPYKGAPISIAIVTPAVAGPFDLGSVVVRSAAYVNPVTAQITVKSDPIPTILHGIPLDLRDIRVSIDRPGFTVAPTNCKPMTVGARVGGAGGGLAELAANFQVRGCGKLNFTPHLTTRIKGATRRAANPQFVSVLSAKPGQANIKKAVVALPRSIFLDNSHIRTICTRVRFAENRCPKGSIYGRARAFSPLLDYPVEGPVYLRSSDNLLPDLVVALRGPARQPVAVDLVGRIDSHRGGMRTTFTTAPDVPVRKFVLRLRGGNRGLLINSRDHCANPSRTTVQLDAQNGATYDFRPLLRNDCGKKKGKKSKRAKGHERAG